MHRTALYALLAVVAASAAVLSFAALRDLALLCGFTPQLAWLLPVTVDAGAAAGSIAWLARWTPPAATTYGRTLALVLLGLSVGGNALGHGLEAYRSNPHWLVVVGVSAIAPAVLGALVHLVVLMGRQPELPVEVLDPSLTSTGTNQPTPDKPEPITRIHLVTQEPAQEEDRAAELIAAGAGRKRLARELDITESAARRLLEGSRPKERA